MIATRISLGCDSEVETWSTALVSIEAMSLQLVEVITEAEAVVAHSMERQACL
jgi:hypothetical protein